MRELVVGVIILGFVISFIMAATIHQDKILNMQIERLK